MSPCVNVGAAIVCGSMGNPDCRRILRCWGACEGARRQVVEHHGGIWYGSEFYCVACGDSWADGYLAERPFQRGWREKAKKRHRARWNAAGTRAEFRAFIRAEIDSYDQYHSELRKVEDTELPNEPHTQEGTTP